MKQVAMTPRPRSARTHSNVYVTDKWDHSRGLTVGPATLPLPADSLSQCRWSRCLAIGET